ncbi:ATP/GTP-binding protein [Acidipropionibacterium timonense]|uniref:ATP/GTP-binding protein n=1 Tax=Acidipropionibacterium timonense TaxID=2161818 RepID=UPI001FDA4F0A|nr:ATP/GTP-binding protein [Acidipropionibacterium timonense]
MRTRRTAAAAPTVPRPGARGWTGPGAGRMVGWQTPPSWRGTSVQVCGLWPWVAGSGTPMVGVPMGRHLFTGATVCCDPLSWYQRAGLISNPSAFVLGLPGLGKSSTVRHMLLGLAAYGVHGVVLGDLKPDYVDLVKALGGQVISIGPGRGGLNPLDDGGAIAAARRIGGQAGRDLLAEARSRRLTVLAALVQITRGVGGHVTDRETTILDRCLDHWDTGHDQPPVLADVLDILRAGPPPVRQAALDRGDQSRYLDRTENLEATLTALAGGTSGQIFARPTSQPMRLDRSVVFDVSSIGAASAQIKGAVLMACWSYGFGVIETAQALAAAGLACPQRHLIVMDELWQVLRAGAGMVDRVDALTRLNRNMGVGQVMITHTMADLEALATDDDRAKAKGFVERSGMVLAGGLPREEMDKLTGAIALSSIEQDMLTSWTDPPTWDQTALAPGDEPARPGRGKFLIKVGGRPGIPVGVHLTGVEVSSAINDTAKLWHDGAA